MEPLATQTAIHEAVSESTLPTAGNARPEDAATPKLEIAIGIIIFLHALVSGSRWWRRHCLVLRSESKPVPAAPTRRTLEVTPRTAVAPRPTAPLPHPAARKPGALVVSELLTKHRDAVEQLRTAASLLPQYDPRKHDDIVLLRFVMSYPAPSAAATAVRKALALREAMALDEVARTVLSSSSRNWLGGRPRYWTHMLPAVLHQPDPNGPLMLIATARRMGN